MSVLLLAEITDGALNVDATGKAVSACAALGDITVLACGASAKDAAGVPHDHFHRDKTIGADGTTKGFCFLFVHGEVQKNPGSGPGNSVSGGREKNEDAQQALLNAWCAGRTCRPVGECC